MAEIYDGFLNDINGFHVEPADVASALNSTSNGPVAEGRAGGGTGMVCYDLKEGIGTSSCHLAAEQGSYTVGGRNPLRIGGLHVGAELPADTPVASAGHPYREDTGSIIISVAATDAPLLPHQTNRLARRATVGRGVRRQLGDAPDRDACQRQMEPGVRSSGACKGRGDRQRHVGCRDDDRSQRSCGDRASP